MTAKAAPPRFPYREHRTMAVVLHDEAWREFYRLPVRHRAGRTVDQFMKCKQGVRG